MSKMEDKNSSNVKSQTGPVVGRMDLHQQFLGKLAKSQRSGCTTQIALPANIKYTVPIVLQAVLWIRIFFLDPELLFRIQQKIKEQINKNLIYNFRP